MTRTGGFTPVPYHPDQRTWCDPSENDTISYLQAKKDNSNKNSLEKKLYGISKSWVFVQIDDFYEWSARCELIFVENCLRR